MNYPIGFPTYDAWYEVLGQGLPYNPTGLGFTPSELTAIQQQIDARVSQAGSKIEAAIIAKGNAAITAISQQAKEAVAMTAARTGAAAAAKGEEAAKKAVWKAAGVAAIGGGLLGGLLGFYLARRR